MATLTVVERRRLKEGSCRLFCTVTMSATYTTGGEALAVGDASIGAFDGHVELHAGQYTSRLYVPVWDDTNSKVMVFNALDGTQVAAASDLSGLVFPACVHGNPDSSYA